MSYIINCAAVQLDDVALEGLMSRCSNIRHLSLSWTGGGGQITEPSLCRWLKLMFTMYIRALCKGFALDQLITPGWQ